MIIPSIDLVNGQAVQLRQGKDHVLTDPRAPLALAQEFNRYGEVAVVDLDAALSQNVGGPNQTLIHELCRVADVRVGGGIRTIEHARRILRAGAKQIIIGTAATPEFLEQLPRHRVLVAIDHKDGHVVDQGWTSSTGESVLDRARRLEKYCGGFLCTFVATEGTLQGMDQDAILAVKNALNVPLTVAGGVATTEEATAISKLGVDVQVGMALYTGKLDLAKATIDSLDFDKYKTDDGLPALIPTVVQCARTKQVLMLAYSSQASLDAALQTGKGVYYSRSRKELWTKGESSGHTQQLVSVRTDCDKDALVFTVNQQGPACHTEAYSCFDQGFQKPSFNIHTLYDILKDRQANPKEGSFTQSMLQNREKLYRKLMEEAFEVTRAPDKENFIWEIADLTYFASVVAVAEGIEWSDIEAELSGRER